MGTSIRNTAILPRTFTRSKRGQGDLIWGRVLSRKNTSPNSSKFLETYVIIDHSIIVWGDGYDHRRTEEI